MSRSLHGREDGEGGPEALLLLWSWLGAALMMSVATTRRQRPRRASQTTPSTASREGTLAGEAVGEAGETYEDAPQPVSGREETPGSAPPRHTTSR